MSSRRPRRSRSTELAVLQMAADFGLAFVRVTVMALTIWILAPAFGGVRSLSQALKLSAARLTTDPKAKNLLIEIQTDPRFNSVRHTPEFQDLTRGPSVK